MKRPVFGDHTKVVETALALAALMMVMEPGDQDMETRAVMSDMPMTEGIRIAILVMQTVVRAILVQGMGVAASQREKRTDERTDVLLKAKKKQVPSLIAAWDPRQVMRSESKR
jgi:hypothetical protein